MEKQVTTFSRYQMKVVIFDIQAECKVLKKELSDNGILIIVPFFGVHAERTLQELLVDTEFSPEDCLMLTNNEYHAKMAATAGMAVAGCIEGHFEIPKSVTLLEAPEEVSVGYLNMLYCHAKKLPAVIAETKRCFIREMSQDNLDELYEILTDKDVTKYLNDKAGSKEEELEKLVAYIACAYHFFGYGYWGVFSKETGELIGRAGFREGSEPLEAGYVFKRSEWGKGFATEVLMELIRYGEEELGCTEIYATIDERNTASLRVAEKCGIVCNRLRA